jgi:putative membrane protein
MIAAAPQYLCAPWLQVKLVLVALVIGYHLWCYRLVAAFAQRRPTHSERWFRWFNEVPSLLLIAIVILAVVKPGLPLR